MKQLLKSISEYNFGGMHLYSTFIGRKLLRKKLNISHMNIKIYSDSCFVLINSVANFDFTKRISVRFIYYFSLNSLLVNNDKNSFKFLNVSGSGFI